MNWKFLFKGLAVIWLLFWGSIAGIFWVLPTDAHYSGSHIVTDPKLLAQLNAPDSDNFVTDPKLLAQLNAPDNAPGAAVPVSNNPLAGGLTLFSIGVGIFGCAVLFLIGMACPDHKKIKSKGGE